MAIWILALWLRSGLRDYVYYPLAYVFFEVTAIYKTSLENILRRKKTESINFRNIVS